ncbi:unnamed protein product [Anisakis simplex]|uniref:NERD domain-containing protein n=1 Tax=Anisakis simplex TaxID=6269 RepID=A0A0M3J671_ANISI|nr:unnamed protein product [Anisakis simplex]
MFAVSGDGSKVVRGGRPDRVVIFLHNVETGLVRVHIDGDWTKWLFRSLVLCGLPGPLFDGCVVSQIALPALLRLTIISIARRKTVELENYQMVYSRRRVAIQEFARKYALKQTYAEFVERVISD